MDFNYYQNNYSIWFSKGILKVNGFSIPHDMKANYN